MKAVQELLGHSTMEMTMRYAHLSPDVRKDAVRLLDGHLSVHARGNIGATETVAASNLALRFRNSGGGAGNRTRVRKLHAPCFYVCIR